MNGHSHSLAVAATLHCLAGCALGEITGLIVGTAFHYSNFTTLVLSIVLAFLFGYSLSVLPLLKSGMKKGDAFKIVLAADTLSIATMELVDTGVMVVVPGAMDASVVQPLFWISMIIALTTAFFAALPVNKYLLARGKGHALMHHHH